MVYLDGRHTMTWFSVVGPPIFTKGFQSRLLHCFTGRYTHFILEYEAVD